MNTQYFRLVCFLMLFSQVTLWSQTPNQGKTVPVNNGNQITIEHSDFFDISEKEIPGAIVLTGNVVIVHEGVRMTCNKAYRFAKTNFVKVFGNVQMVQGDTLFVTSKYAEYNGNTKFAYATGDVVMRDPKMTLTTDTINFDRKTQEAYYNSFGTIHDPENTLTSKSGRYFLNQKKFQFQTAVTVTNPRQTIKTNHLDYYTNSGHAYVFGPSTITSSTNTIYTEKGFYDTKKDEGKLLKKSKITYKDRLIEGDDIFYDRKLDFARAKNNVKVTDTINHFIVKGHYAEVYKQKDSMFITKKAVAITLFEKDSVYFHAKKLLITGKPGDRIIRGFNNARFYKTDMSGKCDSIHSNEKVGLTQMIGKPILWNGHNQMTGDVIHLISNSKTEKIDSLKVLNNAFIISKDTIGTGYNQVKGQNLYGKFLENKLHEVNVVKNTEVIFYMRNDKQELIGINKELSSSINMILNGNQIESITFFTKPDGIIYPEADLPENARKLKGFIWRGDERILTKDDIFPKEELDLDAKIQAETKIKELKIDEPMEPTKETLEYDKPAPEKDRSEKKEEVMMKKLILLILVNIISLTCFGQEDENATTLIFNDNTTIKGLGEIKKNKIYFKLKADDKPDEWSYDSVKGIIFSGYGFSEKYEYVTPKKRNTKPMIMQVIEEGNVNLYKEVKFGASIGLNANSNSGIGIGLNPYGSSTTYYVQRRDEKQATDITFSFRDHCLKYFTDCEIIIKKIKKRDFTSEKIPEMITYYNNYCDGNEN